MNGPHRYHLTDENPFTVITAEGKVTVGSGWLIITEVEYEQLRALQVREAQMKEESK